MTARTRLKVSLKLPGLPTSSGFVCCCCGCCYCCCVTLVMEVVAVMLFCNDFLFHFLFYACYHLSKCNGNHHHTMTTMETARKQPMTTTLTTAPMATQGKTSELLKATLYAVSSAFVLLNKLKRLQVVWLVLLLVVLVLNCCYWWCG